jgi:hypothetical protein
MNGIEVAVKFPKTKLTLRGNDLKKFEKEVAFQAKVCCALSFKAQIGFRKSSHICKPMSRSLE